MRLVIKMQFTSVLLGIFVTLPLVSFGNQDIQTRFDNSLKAFRSMQNMEVVWLDTLQIKDPEILAKVAKAKTYSRTFQYSFTASGSKFRGVCKLISGSQTNLATLNESAYDGDTYVTYSGDTRYLTKSSKLPETASGESVGNPLVMPFFFMNQQSDKHMICLLRPADIAADDFAKGLRMPSGQSSNGMFEISLPGLSLGKQPTEWKITIGESGDFFNPRKITHIIPGIKSEVIYQLLDYTNLGNYWFPTRIKMTSTTYPLVSPPTITSTDTQTVISASVPEHIPDSTFRLDAEEKSAATIWNCDEKNFERIAPKYAALKAKVRSEPKIYDESVDGANQIAAALVIAKKENKSVLLQFGANYCAPCHELDDLFKSNKDVAELLKRDYVVVLIDVNKEHNQNINKKYGNPTRFGIPAIVILNPEGKQLPVNPSISALTDGDAFSSAKVLNFLKK